MALTGVLLLNFSKRSHIFERSVRFFSSCPRLPHENESYHFPERCSRGFISSNRSIPVATAKSRHNFGPTSIRGFSQSVENENGSQMYKLVYEAPFAKAVRAIKLFSISSSICMILGAPVLILASPEGVSLVGRIAMSSLLILFSVSTTLILHWFTKSYVSKMWFDDKNEQLKVNTFTIFGRVRDAIFSLSEAGPPPNVASFASFQAKEKNYFLHTEIFNDRLLLNRILQEHSQFEKFHSTSDQTTSS